MYSYVMAMPRTALAHIFIITEVLLNRTDINTHGAEKKQVWQNDDNRRRAYNFLSYSFNFSMNWELTSKYDY